MAKATRMTPELVENYRRKGYWTSNTLAGFWDRNARAYPNQEALVDSSRRLTWAQGNQLANRLALGLLEMGFKRDDLLAVQLPNCVELYLLRLACEKAGLLCLQTLRSLRHREMEHSLGLGEASGVVIPWRFRDFDHWEMIQEIKPHLPALRHILVTGGEVPPGAISVETLMQNPIETKYPPDYIKKLRCTPGEFSLVGHTTGTTGMPKLVELTIGGVMYIARWHNDDIGLTSRDVLGIIGPAAHGPNIPAYYGAAQRAAKIVMLETFDAEAALRLIEKERVTVTGIVPAILAMMLEHPGLDKYNLSSLRVIFCAGSSLPYTVAETAERKIGAKIIQLYGAVDTGGITKGFLKDPADVRWGTVGKPYPGNEIKLVDEAGAEVGHGEVGEVMTRGPTNDVAYYRDPGANALAWTVDGWRCPGDLGRWDSKGNLMIVGRNKDVIIRGGQNIYPIEIESLLQAHPCVAGVAVVRMPDPVMGEKACAFVVPQSGCSFTFEDMISCLKAHKIAAFKLPERLEICQALPLAGEQKMDKKALERVITEKLRDEGAG
ncbi:MAG: acyl-CoA synthetase (AMP-forming)/AMP-acid ligase II [Dehalococcoidia bacterium]|nr:acyl-CoA synthetase (AMP-forming)/AMP-acid ligase II [Dehalococcoidia bacterium]